MVLSVRKSSSRRLAAAVAATLVAGIVLSSGQAWARPFGHQRLYGHHRGLGVGAAIGLGVLGAAAAGAAASQNYNGYPVYPDGAHTGYGYDYYPDHGGYSGPY